MRPVAADDHGALAAACAAEAERRDVLPRLAAELDVSAAALERLGVGWYAAEQCTTWPLCDHTGRHVTGIVRRYRDGAKKIMAGHKAGLYLPHDLPADLAGLRLLICEGATDAATALDMGLWAIGRFSCTHGAALLTRLIVICRPARVVVVSDSGNEHELRGAETLAAALTCYARDVRLVYPPAKDLRAWRRAGAGADGLHRLIEAATPRRLKVRAA